jgi:hypothetical protein
LAGADVYPGARRGRGSGGSLDPKARYGVACSGQFSEGWQTGAAAPVEGTPPGLGAASGRRAEELFVHYSGIEGGGFMGRQ